MCIDQCYYFIVSMIHSATWSMEVIRTAWTAQVRRSQSVEEDTSDVNIVLSKLSKLSPLLLLCSNTESEDLSVKWEIREAVCWVREGKYLWLLEDNSQHGWVWIGSMDVGGLLLSQGGHCPMTESKLRPHCGSKVTLEHSTPPVEQRETLTHRLKVSGLPGLIGWNRPRTSFSGGLTWWQVATVRQSNSRCRRWEQPEQPGCIRCLPHCPPVHCQAWFR